MEYDNDIHQKYSRVVGVGACLFNLYGLQQYANDFSCGTDVLFMSMAEFSSNTSSANKKGIRIYRQPIFI